MKILNRKAFADSLKELGAKSARVLNDDVVLVDGKRLSTYECIDIIKGKKNIEQPKKEETNKKIETKRNNKKEVEN